MPDLAELGETVRWHGKEQSRGWLGPSAPRVTAVCTHTHFMFPPRASHVGLSRSFLIMITPVTDEAFTVGDQRVRLDDLTAWLEHQAPAGVDPETLAMLQNHLREVLERSEESASIVAGLPARTGKGTYVAVGSLSRLTLSGILGPVLHVVAVGGVASGAARLLRWDSSWRPRLLTIYARLDGLERSVFETVHEGQNKWITVNYDAKAEGNFAATYGRVAPTRADIIEALACEAPASDVQRALDRLVYRGILDTDDSRYWIRF